MSDNNSYDFVVLVTGLVLVVWVGIMLNTVSNVRTEIPIGYTLACDDHFGKGQWKTINVDWIDFDPKFSIYFVHLKMKTTPLVNGVV